MSEDITKTEEAPSEITTDAKSENTTNEAQEPAQPTELETLKARADMMKITYHPKIGVEKLRAKVNEAIEATQTKEVVEQEAVPDIAPVPELSRNQKRRKHINQRKKTASALVRVMITCMNPQKSELSGELVSVGSSKMGTFTRFVPYNKEWHVPRIMLDTMKDSKCTIFYTVKGPQGQKIRKGKLIPEFSITELPPLTNKQLDELAKAQARAGSIQKEGEEY